MNIQPNDSQYLKLQPLTYSIILTLLLLIGNGVLLFISTPLSALIQLSLYFWVAFVLISWIQWQHTKPFFNHITQHFNVLTGKQILISLAYGIGLFILGGLGYALSEIVGLSQSQTGPQLGSASQYSLVIYGLTTIIIAPLLEEVAFRGLIINRLQSSFSPWIVCTISSLLFSLYHLNSFQLISTFLLGIGLALLIIRHNNLWLPIIAHATYNALGFLIFMLVNGPT